MNGLLSAFQFLTILHFKKDSAFSPNKMLPFFPIVGLLIGVLLCLFDGLIGKIWERPVASLMDVLFLAWITGSLHLDGLGDTADGLYGKRSKEKALAIMKDSRMGAMGAIAIFFVLALKWAALSQIGSGRWVVLMAVPAFSRGSLLFGTRFLAYGRAEGTGKDFFSFRLQWRGFWGLVLPIGLSFLGGLKGISMIPGFVVLTVAILLFYKKRMNCITGDMLGAMNEICETGLFLVVAAGGA